MVDIVSCILTGIIGGLIYALTGLMKSMTKEKPDWKKFLRTLIISIFAGLSLALTGQEVTVDAINVMIAAGEVAVIEQLILAIFRVVVRGYGKT